MSQSEGNQPPNTSSTASPVSSGENNATTTTTTNDKTSNSSNFWTSVVDTSILPSIQECYDFVVSDDCGAVTTFVGTTRNTFHGKVVTKLSYEAYIPMANKELIKLCHQTVDKFSTITKIAAHHCVGECPVGKPSVVLACSSPHRRDALHAIEYLIDTLKAQVPIWKLEHYEGDDAVWKENIEWKQSRRRTSKPNDDNDDDNGTTAGTDSQLEPVRVMVRQDPKQT